MDNQPGNSFQPQQQPQSNNPYAPHPNPYQQQQVAQPTPQTSPAQTPHQAKKSRLKPAILLPLLFLLGLILGWTGGYFTGSSGKSDLESEVSSLNEEATKNTEDLALFEKYREEIVAYEDSVASPTGQNIQARARDTERKADINSVHTQLEVFYTDNGFYPGAADGLAVDNFPGLDPEALISPDGTTIQTITSGSAKDTDYFYRPQQCLADQCQSYEISTLLEEDNSSYSKQSLN